MISKNFEFLRKSKIKNINDQGLPWVSNFWIYGAKVISKCSDGEITKLWSTIAMTVYFTPHPTPIKKIYPFFWVLLTVFFCCWCELKNLLERYAYSSYVTNSPFGHRLVVRGLPLNLYSLGAPLSPNISIYYLISIKFEAKDFVFISPWCYIRKPTNISKNKISIFIYLSRKQKTLLTYQRAFRTS